MDAAKIQLNPRFIVDEAGKCQEVVLALSEYRELIDLLEDRLDSAELDEAIERAEGFTPLDDVVSELRRDGLL
jgi:hypothetical protein